MDYNNKNHCLDGGKGLPGESNNHMPELLEQRQRVGVSVAKQGLAGFSRQGRVRSSNLRLEQLLCERSLIEVDQASKRTQGSKSVGTKRRVFGQ